MTKQQLKKIAKETALLGKHIVKREIKMTNKEIKKDFKRFREGVIYVDFLREELKNI